MTMLMKQLKLHIKYQYKAILTFWAVALLIKGTMTATDLKGIKIAFYTISLIIHQLQS